MSSVSGDADTLDRERVEETRTGGAGATQNSTGPSKPPSPRARLRIAQPGTTRDVLLTEPLAIVGREPSNAVALADPLVSRWHARIVVESGEFWIEDLKSRNGTMVNGATITRQKLTSGDQITIGDANLTFTRE